eukprot:636370-Karenia_brevis.AAC.1
MFTIPYIWGGDYNREPSQTNEQRFRLGPHSLQTPIGVKSTCHNGGLIDYFITSPDVVHWGKATKVVVGTPVSPHVPVLLTIHHQPHSIQTWQQ